MENMQELLQLRKQLLMLKRLLDRNARFETEEGSVFAQTLVQLTMVELRIEALQKEKIARK